MRSLSNITIFSKQTCKINFSGGELSSDSGILCVSEFIEKIGLSKFLESIFDAEISPLVTHKPSRVILQKVLQIIAGYDADDHADHLAIDPAFRTALAKERLASQPTISRFYQKSDITTENRLEAVLKFIRQQAYLIEMPDKVILDIDSTLLETHGKQEGGEFIHHYGAVGYHPLLCYDGVTGDLLLAELREGDNYCGTGAAMFLRPLLDEFKVKYPKTMVTVRGDSGFAMPDIYDEVERHETQRYVIRLKSNAVLTRNTEQTVSDVIALHEQRPNEKHNVYGEFLYKAKEWNRTRRVVYKVEHKPGELFPNAMYIVTNTDMSPRATVDFYCKRGNMENFIKESKNSFGFNCMRSHEFAVNKNRLLVAAIAHAVFNLFRRLSLPDDWKKFMVDEIRLRIIKVASRIASHAREKLFKFCSSYAYQEEFKYIHQCILNFKCSDATTV